MCIICVKPAGAVNPTDAQLYNMLTRNPDGAGLCYNLDSVIILKKGLNLQQLKKELEKVPASSGCIIHARISTSGGVCAELCHPYPVCNDIKKMRRTSQRLTNGFAVAHNGIFNEFKNKDLNNDTTQFIANYLYPLATIKQASGGSLLDKDIRPIIDRLCGAGYYSSKLAIINTHGDVALYGSGWVECGGLYFSNDTYKPAPVYSYNWSNYNHGGGGYYTPTTSTKPKKERRSYTDWTPEDWDGAKWDDVRKIWLKASEVKAQQEKDERGAMYKELADARKKDPEFDAICLDYLKAGYTLQDLAEMHFLGELL